MSWYGFIQKYFGLFFGLGILIGLIFSSVFDGYKNLVLPLLGTVMLFTFLSIDIRQALSNLKRFHNIAAVFIITKVILPILLYHLAKPLGTDISIAVFMLCITPFASISPTLTTLLEGDTEFILLNQILMTLLAPFYMPILIMLVLGAEIQLNPVQMFKILTFLIFVPFGLSLIIRPLLKSAVLKTKKYFGAVNILLIMAVICILLATAAGSILENPLHTLPQLGLSYLLGLILILSGLFIPFFLDRKKRIGLSVSVLYMNVGLTAVVASGFFSPEVLLFILIYEIPVNTLPTLMRSAAERFRKRD